MARRTVKGTGGIQATFESVKGKINTIAADKIEERLEEVSYFATHTALTEGGRGDGVDTGAYVTSFSIGPAGFGGGRSKTSDNKSRNQSPQAMKQEGYELLLSDIRGMGVKEMLEDNSNVKFTLRNRSTHATDVENGKNWSSSGYHVFEKIRSRFG